MMHEQVIRRILSEFHEPWMDDSDREEFDSLMIMEIGSQLDEAITAGINSGHAIERQEEMARRFLRGIVKRGE